MLSSKYGLLMVSVFLVLFIGMVADSIELVYISGITETFEMPENAIEQAFSILTTIGKLMTFRLVSIPIVVQVFINTFLLYPIMIFVGYVISTWIRGTD